MDLLIWDGHLSFLMVVTNHFVMGSDPPITGTTKGVDQYVKDGS